MLVSAWRGYQRLLAVHPLRTQMISAGLLSGVGEATAQLGIERRRLREYDVPRTLRFVGVTVLWVTPILGPWLHFLETRVALGGAPALRPLKRVLLDQLGMSPFFLSSVLIWLRVVEGDGLRVSLQRWRADFWEIWCNGLKLWPAAALINFYLIPPIYRLVFAQSVALVWNTYLAWRTNVPEKETPPHDTTIV